MIRFRLGKMSYSSLIKRYIKTFKLNSTNIICWWGRDWKEACNPKTITTLGKDINTKCIQDLALFRVWVGLVIVCDKPNFEIRSWSWEPSKLVLSISHHYFDFALKLPIITLRNELQLDSESRFSSWYDLKIWNSSCVWLKDL